MSLTYAWTINSLKLKDETNHEGATLNRAVYQTHWTITGTNSAGQSGSWAGATPLSAANVPAGSFVAFDDLTEDTVIGWIKNIVENDADDSASIDELIISYLCFPGVNSIYAFLIAVLPPTLKSGQVIEVSNTTSLGVTL